MFDFFLDSLSHFVKNGFSLATLVGLLIVTLRNRKLLKLLHHKLPNLIKDAEDDRNQRIEQKLDAIGKAVGAEWIGPPEGSQKKAQMNLKRLYALLHKDIYRGSRSRRKKMKTYLKKLTKTKFQAYLLTTIVNLGTLIAMWTGNVNLEGQMEEWMPGIAIIVQLLATGIYQIVEGKVDAAAVKANGTEQSEVGEVGDHGPAV